MLALWVSLSLPPSFPLLSSFSLIFEATFWFLGCQRVLLRLILLTGFCCLSLRNGFISVASTSNDFLLQYCVYVLRMQAYHIIAISGASPFFWLSMGRKCNAVSRKPESVGSGVLNPLSTTCASCVLNSLASCRFTFLSAIKSVVMNTVQCVKFVPMQSALWDPVYKCEPGVFLSMPAWPF